MYDKISEKVDKLNIYNRFTGNISKKKEKEILPPKPVLSVWSIHFFNYFFIILSDSAKSTISLSLSLYIYIYIYIRKSRFISHSLPRTLIEF